MAKRKLALRNEQIVTMRLDEELDKITFWNSKNKLAGGFDFIERDDIDGRYLLARMQAKGLIEDPDEESIAHIED